MTDMAELEARIRELEDIRELEALLARYSFNADLQRLPEWVDLFTEDGLMDLIDMNLPRYEGTQELEEFIGGPQASNVAYNSFHIAAPTVFYVEGDEATGEGYSILLSRDMSDGMHDRSGAHAPLHPLRVGITSANYSHWRFRRVDGKWKIVSREVKLIASPHAEDVFKATRN